MDLMGTFNHYYYDLADPRLRDWFVIKSAWSPILVVLIYIILVFKLAPNYMKNRPAYELKTFLKCYNLFQIITNLYIVKELSICYPFLRTFECRPIIYSTDPCAMRIVSTAKIAILLKIIDLIETVVFVLRKKNSQVTILHLYHHITTVLVSMIFTRYFSVESISLFPILNCSVHVVMYFYYFLSNFEGPIKTIINPYKRYLTIMQMGQFLILILQLVSFLPEHCSLPPIPIYIMILNIIFNFGLFFNFYKKAYMTKNLHKLSEKKRKH